MPAAKVVTYRRVLPPVPRPNGRLKPVPVRLPVETLMFVIAFGVARLHTVVPRVVVKIVLRLFSTACVETRLSAS